MVLSQLLPWFLLLGALKVVEPCLKGSRKKSRRALSRPRQPKSPSTSHRLAPRPSAASASLIGWWGELQTRFILWLHLPKTDYRRFHNVIIPSSDGTTQIDHIIVSPFGIFVLETKNMKGWIFGSERQPQWTQGLFGQNFPFQNPLHQNYGHIQNLARQLNLETDLFHSIVLF